LIFADGLADIQGDKAIIEESMNSFTKGCLLQLLFWKEK